MPRNWKIVQIDRQSGDSHDWIVGVTEADARHEADSRPSCYVDSNGYCVTGPTIFRAVPMV